MAAAAQVLDTVELLEMIILELPIRDVFTDQRVSRHWRSTIVESVKLQQALFLKPSTLVESEITSKMVTFSLDSSCVDILAAPGRKTVFPSVLLIRAYRGLFSNIKEIAGDSAMGNPEASWRKMLICQPPMERMAFLTSYGDTAPGLRKDEDLDLPGVETMFGAKLCTCDLQRIVILEAKPHIGILTFAQSIPEYMRQYDLALRKGLGLTLAGGGEKELDYARSCFVVDDADEYLRRVDRARQRNTLFDEHD
ncbi:hypothetical protein PRZ48_011122 [Zasmidium cellare]|uniref:F-box domain-containing protein n=1 Tax=Zasmidium cellare TaxID=395010 RepID=A0ABR0EAV4_ZASCE|nr:hypothetical protein PRZ48_011122 [Zasmidium cellare]